jgi:hypothetical protein
LIPDRDNATCRTLVEVKNNGLNICGKVSLDSSFVLSFVNAK